MWNTQKKLFWLWSFSKDTFKEKTFTFGVLRITETVIEMCFSIKYNIVGNNDN